jgi:small subunit ribosomal protein S21|tara:strand:- start:4426 stop:4641 length:216 start_codon:yes stop_codon:yes gene_type:complete
MATNHVEKPRRNEDPNRFIKRFIKKCKKLGIIDEVKERKHYQKPSERRRLAKKRAISKHKKELRKRQRSQN